MKTDDIVKELKAEVTEKVTQVVQESLTEVIQQEIAKSLGKAMVEGDFLRSVNKDIRSGLANIYSEISGVKNSVDPGSYDEAKELFNDTENKLDYIIQSTEEASLEIMDEVESIQELQATAKALIKEKLGSDNQSSKKELERICQDIDGKLLKIMTSLSFQDITSQYIKKVISVLKNIEQIVFDIYVSSGIMMQSKEANPDKDISELKDESRRKVAEYKEKSEGFNQNDVDDLLKQFDL